MQSLQRHEEYKKIPLTPWLTLREKKPSLRVFQLKHCTKAEAPILSVQRGLVAQDTMWEGARTQQAHAALASN